MGENNTNDVFPHNLNNACYHFIDKEQLSNCLYQLLYF